MVSCITRHGAGADRSFTRRGSLSTIRLPYSSELRTHWRHLSPLWYRIQDRSYLGAQDEHRNIVNRAGNRLKLLVNSNRTEGFEIFRKQGITYCFYCIFGGEGGITRAVPALALRAVLRTFKIAPDDFVKPKGSHRTALFPILNKPPPGGLFNMAEREGFEPSVRY